MKTQKTTCRLQPFPSAIRPVVILLVAVVFWSGNRSLGAVHTWIIAGQSNAEGYAITEAPVSGLAPADTLAGIGRSDLDATHDDIRFFQGLNDYNQVAKSAGLDMAPKETWHAMLPYEGLCYDWGNGRGNESGRRFGPELSFGAMVQQALGEEIAIIKYARGGASLASSSQQNNDGSWRDFDPTDSRLNEYDKLINTIDAAVAALPAGDTLVIEGVLWMQGEADAKAALAGSYEANLTEFISELSSDLADLEVSYPGRIVPVTTWPETRFYIGLIANAGTHQDTVRAGMTAVADANDHVQTVDGMNSISLMTNDDWGYANLHYDTAGQVTLGERYASAVMDDLFREWNGGTDWAKFNVPDRRAVWVWNPVSVDGDKTANRNWDGTKNAAQRFFENYKGSRDMFFDFCENKSIRVVYMFSGVYQWTDYSSGTLLAADLYRPFLQEANDRGIQVWYMHYLNDDPNDPGLNTNDSQILEIAQAVDDYNRKNPTARYAGIHCDQEPGDTTVYPGLLNNTKIAYEWIESSGSDLLTSQALRPKWRNQDVTWNGSTKTMNQHMQDWLHHGVLMAYNDNPGTVYSWAQQVVDYATSIGRKAAIGSELGDLTGAWPGSENETWWEEVRAEPDTTRFKVDAAAPVTWEDVMHEVVNREGGESGFDRMVLHTYSSYFHHWFGDYPRDYLLALPGGEYDSAVIHPPKVSLSRDNRPLLGFDPSGGGKPTADAGANQNLPDSDGIPGETVTLDGSGSSDLDGTIVSYEWDEGGSVLASGTNPVVRLSDGPHTITLTVTDNLGNTDTDVVVVSVSAPLTGLIFFDDFETSVLHPDNIYAHDWAISGNALIYGQGLQPNGSIGGNCVGLRVTASITKTLDVSQYEAIIVSFNVQNKDNLVAGEESRFEWSADGGSSWNIEGTYDHTHTTYTDESFALNSSANGISNLMIRFAHNSNTGSHYARIDNVKVEGTLKDTDHDGMPDYYEDAVGLDKNTDDAALDKDGDGQSNFEEYHSGTHPGQASSVFRATAFVPPVTSGEVELAWNSVGGYSYSVWKSTDLSNWVEEATGIMASATSTVHRFTPSTVVTNACFFQIRTHRP